MEASAPIPVAAGVVAAVTLVNGVRVPAIALGTFRLKGDVAKSAVKCALAAGYRHIDTASIYRNEDMVGEALQSSGIAREEIFITSKASPYEHGYEGAMTACLKSLELLQLTYLDMYLIHWPGVAKQPLQSEKNALMRRETWRAFEDLYKSGRCRAIGVSNFTQQHLMGLLQHCSITPLLNQVEIHPWLQQQELRQFCRERGIHVSAYSPLGCGQLLREASIQSLAERWRCTPAQLLISWSLHLGHVVVVKSGEERRIKDNISSAILNSLPAELTNEITSMERGHRFCWSPEGIL